MSGTGDGAAIVGSASRFCTMGTAFCTSVGGGVGFDTSDVTGAGVGVGAGEVEVDAPGVELGETDADEEP